MSREDIIAILGPDLTKVSELLRTTLHTEVPLLSSINDGLLEHSGKMLRPLVAVAMARAAGGGLATDDSIRYAAAVEILHNATLLHDDVADEASTRRGAPTVFSAWGPTPAVLVGDFWLAAAVDLLSDGPDLKWIVSTFSRTLKDLAEGEMLQQQKAFMADTTEADYLRIVFCKTASLFVSACTSAVKSVHGPQEYFDAAAAYGRALGIAFQIKDDIMDYSPSPDSGKPAGIDLSEQKITLPLLGALKGSPREAEIRALVKGIPSHPENCAAVRDFVLAEGGLDYAMAKLEDYIAEAVDALAVLPDSPEKDILAAVAKYNALRTR